MEPFDSSWVSPTGPRDTSQGRADVSPVWWSSDESSFVVSRLDERPDDDFTLGEEIGDKMAQPEQPVQTKAPNTPLYTDRHEPNLTGFAKRLRRQPATACLSAQYLESGHCSTHDPSEAGPVARQTMCPTVATQGDTKRTNHGASRCCQSSACMNQPELIKISSGDRRVSSAQTAAAAMLDVGVCEGIDGSAGQQNVHKEDNEILGPGAKAARTRSSIASPATPTTVWTGIVTAANIGLVQHLDVPNLSPQHAELLNFHSRSVRHASLPPPARQNLDTPHDRTAGPKIGRVKSLMAKFDSKVKAHAKLRKRPRVQAVKPAEVASRKADHEAWLAKVSSSRAWREPPGLKEVSRHVGRNLLRQQETPAHLLQRGHGTDEGCVFEQPPPLVSGSPEVRPHRGDFVLSQARAVKFSRAGKATLIEIPPRESRFFNIGSLNPVEVDLMFSAGARAKSSRRAKMRDEAMQLLSPRSSHSNGARRLVSPIQDQGESRTPYTVPRVRGNAVHPYKLPAGGPPRAKDNEVRFRQLVRRLGKNDSVFNQDAGHAPEQEFYRRLSSAAPAPEQRPAESPAIDQRATGRNHSSLLKHNPGQFGLNNPSQSRVRADSGATASSPYRITAKPTPGDSGCPSLISDDGQEPCDFPEAVADENARPPMFQGSPGITTWQKEDDTASTARDDNASEGGSTLVHVGTSENELFTTADPEEIHARNIRADNLHAGVGTGSDNGSGWLSRDSRALAPPVSFRHGSGDTAFHEQHRRGRGMTARRPDELSLYGACALLRWLVSTSDAPGAPGMRHESSDGLESLMSADEYHLRIGDDERADLIRFLRCLTEGFPLRPEPSGEVSAFIQSTNLPTVL